MIRVLKQGATEAEKTEADRKVRQTVESILEDIAARGDTAVRELSVKFDKWEPPSFRLRPDEIESLMASLPAQVIEDIKFAQAQIRRFAQAQKDALRDIEVETLPGIVLGHKNDRTRTRRLARGATHCAYDVFLGLIMNRVGRVEAEAIEMKFLDPITSVGDEKFAHGPGVWAVEIN